MVRRDRSAAYHPLVREVATALKRRCGITPGAAVVVGVSGGADSVALLRALAILAPRRGWGLRLTVAHVQHHLRADRFAEADARFVARLARRLGLPFVRADLDPGLRTARARLPQPRGVGNTSGMTSHTDLSDPLSLRERVRVRASCGPHMSRRLVESRRDALTLPSPGGRGFQSRNPDHMRGLAPTNTEAWARQARYEALAAIAEAVDASFIAVAHHADDQLETLLMRLLRGSSLRGLSSMRWRRRLKAGGPTRLIRPMLAVDRATIERFLANLRQTYCEDHTNRDVARLRARMRSRVTPELRRIRPDAAHQAVRLADRLRQAASQQARAERSALERFVWADGGRSASLDRAAARAWPALAFSGALRRALKRLGAPTDRLTARALTPIVRAARDTHGHPRRFALARGVTVTVQRRTVTLSSRA